MVQVEVADARELPERAAGVLARHIESAVEERGRAAVALSGGRTPWAAFDALARVPLPWSAVHVFQVDERVVPEGDPARNFAGLARHLLERVGATAHPMPVDAGDLDRAAATYAEELRGVCGDPPVLDVVQLGVGDDGHTASLVPGDPVLDVAGADVAVTGVYQGHRRMTLTFPALNRARAAVFVVAGPHKATVVRDLVRGRRDLPAARVRRDTAVLVLDREAASLLG